MRTRVLLALLFLFIWFFSAISHELDLSRNFNETGDACSFFFPIKVETEDLQ